MIGTGKRRGAGGPRLASKAATPPGGASGRRIGSVVAANASHVDELLMTQYRLTGGASSMKKRTEIVTRERSLDRREGGALGLFIEYDLVRSRPV